MGSTVSSLDQEGPPPGAALCRCGHVFNWHINGRERACSIDGCECEAFARADPPKGDAPCRCEHYASAHSGRLGWCAAFRCACKGYIPQRQAEPEGDDSCHWRHCKHFAEDHHCGYGKCYVDGCTCIGFASHRVTQRRLNEALDAAKDANEADEDEPRLSVQEDDALWDAIAIPGGGKPPNFMDQHKNVCEVVARMLAEARWRPAPDDTAPEEPEDEAAEDDWAAMGCDCDETSPDPCEAAPPPQAPSRRPPYAVAYSVQGAPYEVLVPGDATVLAVDGQLLIGHEGRTVSGIVQVRPHGAEKEAPDGDNLE